jgi:hypothetical protein
MIYRNWENSDLLKAYRISFVVVPACEIAACPPTTTPPSGLPRDAVELKQNIPNPNKPHEIGGA